MPPTPPHNVRMPDGAGHPRMDPSTLQSLKLVMLSITGLSRDALHVHIGLLACLAVKSMTASAAGTIETPGKNVLQKAGLSRTILRNGWSMARSMLEYKAAWSGVMLVAVPPAYTSQACSACGHTTAENRKAQAVFACVACGHRENADRNAAKNILAKAQLMLGGGEAPQPGGRPASTAGYAGTNACEGAAPLRPRPRSAAQGGLVKPPLAGTIPGLSLPGNLDP